MNKYFYIQAWGFILGSFQYYIKDRIAEAVASGAPENATHRKQDGTWATADDIQSEEMRLRVEEHVKYLQLNLA